MRVLGVYKRQWSLACAQDFVGCSFPILKIINWPMGKLNAPACAVLSQASLPSLNELVLSDQGITAAGLSELLQASWPCFTSLELARNNLLPVRERPHTQRLMGLHAKSTSVRRLYNVIATCCADLIDTNDKRVLDSQNDSH